MSSATQRSVFMTPTSDVPLIFVTPDEEKKIQSAVNIVFERSSFLTESHTGVFINEHQVVLLAKGGKLWVVSPVKETK